ncbi:MAG TPA: hypothetical protein VN258_03050 [Mobilitalea sp.]|nr:hypothetical protein [Mobilitalea sp.]
MEKLKQLADVKVSDMVISADRMEIGNAKSSAVMDVEKEYGIKVYSIVNMNFGRFLI